MDLLSLDITHKITLLVGVGGGARLRGQMALVLFLNIVSRYRPHHAHPRHQLGQIWPRQTQLDNQTVILGTFSRPCGKCLEASDRSVTFPGPVLRLPGGDDNRKR